MNRTTTITRKTTETAITVTFNPDGTGQYQMDTGIGFLDHMLAQFAKHGFFDLFITATGDLSVDCHHTAEDVGIVLGDAIAGALGDKAGVRRYGSAFAPMDEALTLCAVDLSGRAFLCFDTVFTVPRLGTLDTEMFEEFFRAVSDHGAFTLHIKTMHGQNNHHIAESIFKAFGRALSEATAFDPRVKGVLSTKEEPTPQMSGAHSS